MRYLIFYISLFSFLAWMQIYYGKGAESCFNDMCIAGVSNKIILMESMFYVIGLIGLHGMVYNLFAIAKNKTEKSDAVRLCYILFFSFLSLFLSVNVVVTTISTT